MSGFEIFGVIGAALPLLVEGLKFYKKFYKENAQVIFQHEEVMNDLIMELNYQHCRFRRSCEWLLIGLVEDGQLKALLDGTRENWEKALEGGLKGKLQIKLGVEFNVYTATIVEIQKNLKQLEEVLGFDAPWYRITTYKKLKWHKRTWKKMKDCLSSGEYKSLLATIGKYNDRLENLRPGTTDREQVLVSGMENRYDGRWDSFRRSASSLYCALYSSWQCSCPGVHTAHFRLEDRTSTMSARQRFRLAFMLPGNYGGPTVTSAVTSAVTEGAGWQDAEFEASESDEDEDEEAVLQRQRGRVSFQPRATSVASRQVLDKQITNLCEELKGCGGSTTARCVGFITEKKRRHYLHVSKRAEFPSAMQRAVSLHELLTGKGSVSSPVPLTIELLDRYELGLLLALSMLQLHATSWLADCWSARDIHFIPTDSESTLRDCAFVVRSFLSAKDQAVAVAATTPAHPAGGGSDIRSVAIRNEAIFRLGVALVELSTNATLESQELERDRRVADLADMNTARRLVSSKQFERSNVREWKAVIDICLYCGFHTSPDFSKKEFRDEYYKYVVRPLQKLCDDAK